MALVGLIESTNYIIEDNTPPVLYHPEWPDHPFIIDKTDMVGPHLRDIYWQCDDKHDHTDIVKCIQETAINSMLKCVANEIKILKKIGYTEITIEDPITFVIATPDDLYYVVVNYSTRKRRISFICATGKYTNFIDTLPEELSILASLILEYKQLKNDQMDLEKKIHRKKQKILYAPGGNGAISANRHFEYLCGLKN